MRSAATSLVRHPWAAVALMLTLPAEEAPSTAGCGAITDHPFRVAESCGRCRGTPTAVGAILSHQTGPTRSNLPYPFSAHSARKCVVFQGLVRTKVQRCAPEGVAS